MWEMLNGDWLSFMAAKLGIFNINTPLFANFIKI